MNGVVPNERHRRPVVEFGTVTRHELPVSGCPAP